MADIERAELLRTWVAALRSGGYRQGTGVLQEKGAYCCLGVLCEVSGLGRFTSPCNYEVNGQEGGAAPRGYLPRALVDLSGIRYGEQMDLAERNDAQGFSFSEIADEIERRHPDVFGGSVERSGLAHG